jgi:CRAL/TRIO domain
VTKAVLSVQSTLQWRKDFGVDIIRDCFTVENTENDTTAHEEMRGIFLREAETGKMYIRGYDNEGRALMYMCQMRENTGHELNNMRYLVHALEKAIACTKQKSGYEKIVLLIDFDGFTMSKSASLSTSRHTLDILQKRYPERMKRSFIMSPPMMFKAFWTLIKPFIDPVTKTKIVFCTSTGQEVLDTVHHSDTLELRAYGTGANLREFDAATYLRLPLHETY